MILRDFSLTNHNTFRLGCKAKTFISLSSEAELSALSGNIDGSAPVLILGGGSNFLFVSDFPGTIIHPEFSGIDTLIKDDKHVFISSGAGVIWDDLVAWCVARGYGGLENLSLIPGTVGASPVQNIGAYGAEVKDTIFKVHAVSLRDGTKREFTNEECRFGYRDSIFKSEMKGEYLITKVIFRLALKPVFRLDYGFLEAETAAIGDINLENIRKAVIKIRRTKLPDPSVIGNAGSFFKNPLVTREKAEELLSDNPLMPVYDDPSGKRKIAAGWLIEQCGWKGKRIGDAGVHDKQALVIVNHGNATGKEIYDLSESVRKSVLDKFGIGLQREVEIAGLI